MQQDQGYIDFLEYYAGASFDYPNGDYLDIFGFLDEICLHLILDENPVIDDDGYYGFCSSVIKISETSNKIDGEIGIGYGFDATGNRLWGVYRFMEEESGEWYCESFLQWLNEVIDKKGRLLD